MLSTEEKREVVNQLYSFIDVYVDMNLRCNISPQILKRNESIIRDFLNSFETHSL